MATTANVTAGLKCAPESSPSEYTMHLSGAAAEKATAGQGEELVGIVRRVVPLRGSIVENHEKESMNV